MPLEGINVAAVVDDIAVHIKNQFEGILQKVSQDTLTLQENINMILNLPIVKSLLDEKKQLNKKIQELELENKKLKLQLNVFNDVNESSIKRVTLEVTEKQNNCDTPVSQDDINEHIQSKQPPKMKSVLDTFTSWKNAQPSGFSLLDNGESSESEEDDSSDEENENNNPQLAQLKYMLSNNSSDDNVTEYIKGSETISTKDTISAEKLVKTNEQDEEEDEEEEEEEEEEVDEEEDAEEEEVDEEEDGEEEEDGDEEEVEEEEVDEEEDEEEEDGEEEEVDEEEDGEEEEDDIDEDEEISVEEIEINDVKYYTTDADNGIIFECLEDGDIGEEIGRLEEGVLFLS